MASTRFPILLVLAVLYSKASVEAMRSLNADFGEPCGGVICNVEKNLVCSVERICVCKTDEITGYPWRYIDDQETCLPIERGLGMPDTKEIETKAQAQQFGNQGQSGGHGHSHGGYNPQPQPGRPGAQQYVRIEGSFCKRHELCTLMYGDLSSCNMDYSYCICHAFKQETGFYEPDRKCHYAFGLGQRCDETAQCILGNVGAENPVCRENPRNQMERICMDGHASGIVISITLILFGVFATRVLANF